jgi:outer membrane cobalamin receptor
VTEHDILKYITTGDLGSDQCVAESAELVAYHYTRSQKECKQQRGDDRVCSLTGDIMDTSGWDSVQKVLPDYYGYNDFI